MMNRPTRPPVANRPMNDLLDLLRIIEDPAAYEAKALELAQSIAACEKAQADAAVVIAESRTAKAEAQKQKDEAQRLSDAGEVREARLNQREAEIGTRESAYSEAASSQPVRWP